jgi:glycosyltransferase involved in cell wall biosynthesis
MADITFFHRSVRNGGYSIQRIFSRLTVEIKKEYHIEEFYLPAHKADMVSVLNNLLFVYKHRNKNGINHISGDIHYCALALLTCKIVVTVHDIGLCDIFTGFKRWCWNLLWVQSLKYVHKVVCVSENTKQEILKYIKQKKDQICVIPNPIFREFIFTPREFNVKQPRILHIGVKANKNIHRTILALSGINCHFRIIGELDEEIEILLMQNKIEFSNIYNISDDEILQEYIQSDIISFPSLFEGFGMPIIEGQAIGRVVLTSNLSPMKDVAGNGAYLVNPMDEQEIHDGFIELINNSLIREQLIEAGVKNIEKYQLKNIVKQYFDLYEQM